MLTVPPMGNAQRVSGASQIWKGIGGMTVHRFAWDDFPAVWIHCEESVVKGHRSYIAAKSGDSDAAFELIEDTLSSEMVADLAERFKRQRPILVSAHALES